MRVIQKLNTQNEWQGEGNHRCEGGNLPAYSPELDPSNIHLFLHLKKHLASQKFHKNKEVITKSLRVCVCRQ
jgi:hypothetical protein